MIKTRTGFAGTARFTLLAGAAALALPGMAHAQDATAEDAVAEDDATGNQIVVTATKREQTLQEVPVAVSAIKGDGKRAEDVTGELGDRIKALVYEYSGRMPLAAAVGVLHLVAYEITRDSD